MADAGQQCSKGALVTLAAWLSPGFPVGAFGYSQGLETAVADGLVSDAAGLQAWCAGVLEHGAGRTDAILLAHAWRAPHDRTLAELAVALAPSAERLMETEAMGHAFADTVRAAWGIEAERAPYPVAMGSAAALAGIALVDVLALYLHAVASNLVTAGVKLIPLGQTEGQAVLAALTAPCLRVAEEAETAPLDALGSASFAADIASMRHESQTVRLFRT